MTLSAPPIATLSDTSVDSLANGVRVVTMRMPHLASVCVSVFVRTGSRDESRRLNGISHFIEHMAFKGTHTRDCQQVNLDAERLGAEVNAHTDKDHTAYHMRGLARHAPQFIHMLADIVRNSTFPEAELERERQVILQEFIEDEDDALSTAYKLFDTASFGLHPIAQPVIGTRRNIERINRDDLLACVQRQYTGANVIVGIAGPVDPELMLHEAEAAFDGMPAGSPHTAVPAEWVGGLRTRRQSGQSQTHVVLGFPTPTLRADHQPSVVAAALFGEGMSSPLLDELRERRGLVYYAACNADISDVGGQFIVEASTSPQHLDELLEQTLALLAAQAERVDAVALERARNQIAVRSLGAQERPFRRLEEAAQDLFVHGRVRTPAELQARTEAVDAAQVGEAFAAMLAARPAVAIAGKLPAGVTERWRARLGG